MQSVDLTSFCCSIKYQSNKSYNYDYSSIPRPCHNFAFILEGEGKILSDNNVISVKKGDVLFIPQNSTYKSNWIANPTCEFLSVHFKFNIINDPFYGKKVPIQLLKTNEFNCLYEKAKDIQKYQSSKDLDTFKYLSSFYYLCEKLLISATVQEKEFDNSNIFPAIEYLENNYDKPCKIEKLASLCYLSPSRFFYLFKQETKESPIVYKNKIAIQKSAQALLLYKDKSIETIAFEHGFVSTIYFRRLFKKFTGKTPSDYRKGERLI